MKRMRIIVKGIVVLLTLLAAFVIWRMIGMTSSGELMWFVAASGSPALANGKVDEALVHHCCQSRIWILTRRTGGERESYAIVRPFAKREGYVWRCEGWTAPRLPLFPYLVYWSDVAFVCDSDSALLAGHGFSLARNVQFGESSVSFTADNGSSLTVSLK